MAFRRPLGTPVPADSLSRNSLHPDRCRCRGAARVFQAQGRPNPEPNSRASGNLGPILEFRVDFALGHPSCSGDLFDRIHARQADAKKMLELFAR